jgi:hypothetical protein
MAAIKSKWLLAERSGDRVIVAAIHAAATQSNKKCSSAPQLNPLATSSGTGLALDAISSARRSSIKVGLTRNRAITPIP